MAIPQTQDSAADVSKEALAIIARVQADDDAKALVKPVIAGRDTLKAGMRSRVDADDDRIVAAGTVNTAEARTDEALKAFGKKVAGTFADAKPPGEKSAEYKRLFDGKTAASFLPAARAERSGAQEAFLARVDDPKTLAEVKKAAAPVRKAIAIEKAAVAALAKADAALAKAQEKEEKSKVAVVVAVRALAGSLQTLFAEDPARAKRLLGQGTGGGRKKSPKKDDPGSPAEG